MGAGASVPTKGPWLLAAKGNAAALQQYCVAGGDPNLVSEAQQCTPLQVAARIDSVECLEVLLRAGADINKATLHGTALHAAASRCCHRAVQLLLRRGADPLLRDADGRTAADLAEAVGYYNLAQELRKHESVSRGAGSSGGSAAGSEHAGGGSAGQGVALSRPSPLANGGAAHAAGLSRPSSQQQQQSVLAVGQPLAAGSWVQLPGQAPAPTFMAHPAPQAPMQEHLPAGQRAQQAGPLAAAPLAAARQQGDSAWRQWSSPPQAAQQPSQQPPQQPAQQQAGQGQQQQQQHQQQAPDGQAAPLMQPPARRLYPRIYGTSPHVRPADAPAPAVPTSQDKATAPVQALGQQVRPSTGGGTGSGGASSGSSSSSSAAAVHTTAALLPAAEAAGPAASGVQVPPQQGVKFPAPAAAALAAAPSCPQVLADAPTAPPASISLMEQIHGRAAPGPGHSGSAALPAQVAQWPNGPSSSPLHRESPKQPCSQTQPSQACGQSSSQPVPANEQGPRADAAPTPPKAAGTAPPKAASSAFGAAPTAAPAAAPQAAPAPPKSPLAAALAGALEPVALLPVAPAAAPSPATAASPLQAALAAAAPSAPPALPHPWRQQQAQPPVVDEPGCTEAEAEQSDLSDEMELLTLRNSLGSSQGGTSTGSAGSREGHAGPSPEVLEDPLLTWLAAQKPTRLQQHARLDQEQQQGHEQHQQQQHPDLPQQQHAREAEQQHRPQQPQQRELQQWERELQGPHQHQHQHQHQQPQHAQQQQAQQAQQQQLQQTQHRELQGQPSSASELAPAGSRRSSRSSSLPDISAWEIDFEDLQMQRTIGEGSFGKVYVAKWNETLVAVKVLLDVEEAQKAAAPDVVWRLSDPILRNLQKECQLMAAMRHPNIVQFMGVTSFPPAMITEYCGKGSLTDVLQGARKSPQKAAQLTWARRLHMLLDAAKGLLYLHRRLPPIIHRDLKSPNLLVDATWHVKVADFNLSKILEDIGDATKSASMQNMNPRLLAPEIVTGGSATPASDVYSFGIVMWEMMTWKLPFGGHNPWTVLNLLMAGKRPTSDPREPLPGPPFAALPAYEALMHRCWDQAPERRPCFAEVIQRLRELLEQTLQQPAER
ncbi:hypothetical protein ABPG75_012152 [Micractinium tetrahymenae]